MERKKFVKIKSQTSLMTPLFYQTFWHFFLYTFCKIYKTFSKKCQKVWIFKSDSELLDSLVIFPIISFSPCLFNNIFHLNLLRVMTKIFIILIATLAGYCMQYYIIQDTKYIVQVNSITNINNTISNIFLSMTQKRLFAGLPERIYSDEWTEKCVIVSTYAHHSIAPRRVCLKPDKLTFFCARET